MQHMSYQEHRNLSKHQWQLLLRLVVMLRTPMVSLLLKELISWLSNMLEGDSH
jgi:hypothetical protein